MINGTQRIASPVSITVGILTSGRAQSLRSLLEALLPQIMPADLVIVLNSTPADAPLNPADMLIHPQVSYHSNSDQHFDFARARNQILLISHSNAVVFIDDDALPLPDWISTVSQNLQRTPISGGPTISTDPLPSWWNHDINWTIGLSPPGTVLGLPGHYPDTSNTAASRQYWAAHPFGITQPTNTYLYTSGREDAEWWTDVRLSGTPYSINFRQAVTHPAHNDRLTMPYITRRAMADGYASWARRPHFQRATAIPWDLMHATGVYADSLFRHPRQTAPRLPHKIWLYRQWGFYKAVWQAPAQQRPARSQILIETFKAAVFQAKIRIGSCLFKILRSRHSHSHFPPEQPRNIFVSADCLLGDTVLLRRHIHSIAATWPQSRIFVSAAIPELLTGLAENVRVYPQTQFSSTASNTLPDRFDIAFAPYYHSGNWRQWRRKLACVGRTFTCDVGFPGRRDYIYARSTLEKNLELHEHENLERLFRLWPHWVRSFPPPASLNPDVTRSVCTKLSHGGVHGRYMVIQLGAGYASKEWSPENWLSFVPAFTRQTQLPLILIGAASWHTVAEQIRNQQSSVPILNWTGTTNIPELLALIANATFFIGSCSGPKHIAIMYDVPTFTLYTSTEPSRWGATENHHLHAYVTALQQKLTAAELQGLPEDHRAQLLTPDHVLNRALHHYNQVTSQRPTSS